MNIVTDWQHSLALYLYAVYPHYVYIYNTIIMHSFDSLMTINQFVPLIFTKIQAIDPRSSPKFKDDLQSHIGTWKEKVEDGVLFAHRTTLQMTTWIKQIPSQERVNWSQRERVKWVQLEQWALEEQKNAPKTKTSMIQASKREKMENAERKAIEARENEKTQELQRELSGDMYRLMTDDREAMQFLVDSHLDSIQSVELQLELLAQDTLKFENKKLALQTLLGDPSGLHHDGFCQLDAIVQATILMMPADEFINKQEAMQDVLSQIYRLQTTKLQRAVLLLPMETFTNKRKALQELLTNGFDQLTYAIQCVLLSLPATNFINKQEGLFTVLRYTDASHWRAMFALPSSEFLNKFQILRYLLTDDVELLEPTELQTLILNLPNTVLMSMQGALIQGIFNEVQKEIPK